MATNKYFLQAGTQDQSEKDLYDDLVAEAIQINGTDFIYLPKTLVKEDALFGEDPSMEFKKGVEIEMYINNSKEYGGEGRLMREFGLEVRKKLTIDVSINRFKETFGETRPKEGDWLWHPITQDLFQILYVDDEPNLWGIGTQNVFTLTVESVEYSHEPINTGIGEIDSIAVELRNDGTDSNGLINDLDAANVEINQIASDVINKDETSPFGDF